MKIMQLSRRKIIKFEKFIIGYNVRPIIVMLYSFVVFCFCFSEGRSQSIGKSFTLKTYCYSCFSLDSIGNLALHDSLPYRSEGTYWTNRTFDQSRTVLIIMDPWIDMASDHLNRHFGEVLESCIIPLVSHSLIWGLPIIVLNNKPASQRYNVKIHPEIEKLVNNGKISILYHQDMDDHGFANFLHSKGFESLIYVGFASNMCVIGRHMGCSITSQSHHTNHLPMDSPDYKL